MSGAETSTPFVSKKKHTYRGIIYRSGFEKKIAIFLTKRKVKFSYEKNAVTYYLPIKGKCISCGSNLVSTAHRYTPDFEIKSKPGKKNRIVQNTKKNVIIEAKGRFTSRDRTKMGRVIKDNPDLRIHMLFMRDNWLTSSKTNRYSDWAKALGIPYHVSSSGEVPKEWLR